MPKSGGAKQYCPKNPQVPSTLGTRANSSSEGLTQRGWWIFVKRIFLCSLQPAHRSVLQTKVHFFHLLVGSYLFCFRSSFFFLVCLKVTKIQNIFLILSFGLKYCSFCASRKCIFHICRLHPVIKPTTRRTTCTHMLAGAFHQSAIRTVCKTDLFEWVITK